MAIVKQCDRCKTILPNASEYRQNGIRIFSFSWLGETKEAGDRFDLCPNCMDNLLNKWLKGTNIINERSE